MELDRRSIERQDFAQARRGYDPEEVDAHLAEIAEAVAELKRSAGSGSGSSLAGAAADQVRTIIEAAERSAQEIEANAHGEADRATGEAKRVAEQERNSAREEARQVRERAQSDAAAHLAKVEEATSGMTRRAATVESDLGGLVDELRNTINSLVESVRTQAGSLESELQEMKSSLADVRPTAIEPERDEPAAAEVEEAPREPEESYEDEADTSDDTSSEEEGEEEPYEEEEAEAPPAEAVHAPSGGGGEGAEGARLIALNMALNGTPREETDRYLEENFDLDDRDTILDEVYARVGG